MTTSIVITGGSGFLGQQLLREGEERGYNMVNIDLRQPPKQYSHIPTLKADFSDPQDTERVFDMAADKLGSIDAVFNMVAIVSYTLPYCRLEGPNVKSADNIAEQSAKYNAFLVHMSGTAALGHSDRALKETDPLHPVEAYGMSKAEAERAVFRHTQNSGLSAIIFRATAPVGPGLESAGINALYRMILEQPVVMATKGSNVSYVSTIDTARAFYFAAEHQDIVAPRPERLSDMVYNLCVHEPFTDRQAGEHLVGAILGEGKKKVVDVPSALVSASSYPIELTTRVANVFRKRRKEPDMAISLARLICGPHYQDPTKFSEVFEKNGFTFMHPTAGDVLDTGVVYKFQTDWKDREPPARIKELLQKQ